MKYAILSLAVALAVLWSTGVPVFAMDKGSVCAGDCRACAKICEDTLKYFNEKGGNYTDTKRVQLITDCIAICKLSADFKERKSEFAVNIQQTCAEICSKCAKACEELKDDKLKECIAKCNECAQMCKSETSKASAEDCCKEKK